MTSAAAVTGGIIIAVRLFVSQSEAAGSYWAGLEILYKYAAKICIERDDPRVDV